VITKQGELWFAQDNDDRIDVLPERKRYSQAGRHTCRCACVPAGDGAGQVAGGVIATQVGPAR
jgi:hypothetical protein